MQRDLNRLAATRFDLVVIGGGIYGTTIACDAAQRGLSVALVDRGDFGSGTSFNNHKTVHGGLRSLQQGNIPEMRQFIRERRALSRIAPHLVHPLPFLIPTTSHPLRSRAAMRAAFLIYNVVSFDRNALPDPSKHLPPGRVVDRQTCLAWHTAIEPDGVTGGATWTDCQMHNTDRLTLAFAQSAVRHGAAAANYAEAVGFLRDAGRVAGVRLQDRCTGAEIDLRARLVLNAAGPWAGRVLAMAAGGVPRVAATRLSKAMNFVLGRRIATRFALGGIARGRFLFLLPWRHLNVVGTSHDPFSGSPDGLTVTAADVDAFLAEVQEAFPAAAITRDDIRLVHRGLLPAVERDAAVRLLKDTQIRDHARDGVPGLITVMGVRYTTARASAERAVSLACRALGRTPPPSRSATMPLEGGDIPRFDTFLEAEVAARPPGVDVETVKRLVLTYGSEYRRILSDLVAEPALGTPLGVECRVTRGEIRYAARREMALKLSDALIRRTEAGSGGHPGPDAVSEAARIMAAELGWSPERASAEVAEVEAFYRLPWT